MWITGVSGLLEHVCRLPGGVADRNILPHFGLVGTIRALRAWPRDVGVGVAGGAEIGTRRRGGAHVSRSEKPNDIKSFHIMPIF